MNINLDHELFKEAVNFAKIKWVEESEDNKEGFYSRNLIKEKKFYEEDFKKWLKVWSLSRIVPLIKIQDILGFVNEVAIPKIFSQDNSPKLILEIVKEAQEKVFNKTQQTSFFSKLAFSLKPDYYTPYDSCVRIALKDLGYNIKEHDYVTFFNSFYDFKNYLEKEFFEELTKESKIIKNRIVDKYLWLSGQYIE